MTLELRDFEDVKNKAEEFYRTLSEVHCPYFSKKVHFNAHGLKHLKFKRDTQARSQQDQYMRFKLIKLAPEIIRLSKTVQGIWKTKSFERIRMHSRTEMVMKNVEYYEFIAVLEGKRVKVIVKQIDDGQLFFWSIIPNWHQNTKTGGRKMHNGNPEED